MSGYHVNLIGRTVFSSLGTSAALQAAPHGAKEAPVVLPAERSGSGPAVACFALDGTILRVGRRRVFLRPTSEAELPILRCRACESAELHLLEDLR